MNETMTVAAEPIELKPCEPTPAEPRPLAVTHAIKRTGRIVATLNDEERARFVAAIFILFDNERVRELLGSVGR